MKIKFTNKTLVASLMASAFLLGGCTDTTSEAEVINKNAVVKTEVKPSEKPELKPESEKEKKTIYTRYDSVVYDVFQDSAKIGPINDKPMIIIFGTNTDPYSDRLKADIQGSKDLQTRIKSEFSSYYLKAHENLRHKLYHEGEYMDVDTKTMISIYGIEATPTLIFTDTNGKAVIVVPGYMPSNQFLVTLDFMKNGAWKGKDRKNGEVYEALKAFYIANGIDVRSKAQ